MAKSLLRKTASDLLAAALVLRMAVLVGDRGLWITAAIGHTPFLSTSVTCILKIIQQIQQYHATAF